MKQNRVFRSCDGKTNIHVLLWIPEGKVRGVLQIVHGMCEFVERYDRFATFLNEHGYVVCANDHLGHGRSVTDAEQLGFFRETDGAGAAIADMRRLHRIMKKKYPDVPYFMLGHSMGSFFARQYMEEYGGELDGVIVMGTGSVPGPVLKFGKALCAGIARARGWHYRSRTVESMAMGSYNKAFKNARTPYDWLTQDEKIVDSYAANPLNTFSFTVNGFHTLFSAIDKAQNKKLLSNVPADLPILLVSGSMDPVGSFTKGVRTAYDLFKKTGKREVDLHFFEGDRHEILNELDYENVYEYLLTWLDEHVK